MREGVEDAPEHFDGRRVAGVATAVNGVATNLRISAIVVDNNGYVITGMTRDPRQFGAFDEFCGDLLRNGSDWATSLKIDMINALE